MTKPPPILAPALALALALSGCTNPSPSTRTRTLALPTPGGGVHLLTTRLPEPNFHAAAIPQLVIIRWNYGSLITSNYWWDLMVSTNLKTWSTLASNLGPGDITVTNDGRRRFFRMRGRP